MDPTQISLQLTKEALEARIRSLQAEIDHWKAELKKLKTGDLVMESAPAKLAKRAV